METSLAECAQNISVQNYTKTIINDYNREEYYDKKMVSKITYMYIAVTGFCSMMDHF